MTREFIRIKRFECLPLSAQKELQSRKITGGLITIKVSENSPKTIIGIDRSLELFSQRLAAVRK